MTRLTRDLILQADDLKREVVPVPEWGADGEVLVRALTAADRVELSRSALNAAGEMQTAQTLDLMLTIPARCVIDEAGQRLFTDADLQALGQKSAVPLQRIMETALRLSALDIAEAKKG